MNSSVLTTGWTHRSDLRKAFAPHCFDGAMTYGIQHPSEVARPKEGVALTKMGQVRHDNVFVFLLSRVAAAMELGNESMTARQQV